jgi:hypothetical protein
MSIDPQSVPQPEVHPSTYIRIAQLQSSALFPSLRRIHCCLSESINSYIFLFLSPLLDSLEFYDTDGFDNTVVGLFLATLSSSPQMLRRIALRSGEMSVDILKKSFVHFKELRSLELSDAVFTTDFSLLEVLGTLPSLENFTLEDGNPEPHPTHTPKNSNSQSRGLRYFDTLESLCVTGSFFLTQHILGFIDSPCLKSIELNPVFNHSKHEPDLEDLLTPSMSIMASKWSQSLKELLIGTCVLVRAPRNGISKCLNLLMVLHELQTFQLLGWRMENKDDVIRRLVMSWPKLRTLAVFPPSHDQTFISLSTLKIIAESCPELRHLSIQLDTATIPPFDISSKSLAHKLEVLTAVGKTHPHVTETSLQIRMARHLDSIFPYLKSIEMQFETNATWSGIRDLVKLCQDLKRGQ